MDFQKCKKKLCLLSYLLTDCLNQEALQRYDNLVDQSWIMAKVELDPINYDFK